MNYALFLIHVPDLSNDDARLQWQRLSKKLEYSDRKTPGCDKIVPSLYVIEIESGLAFLAECIQAAIQERIAYRVLFLEEKPAWILSP